MSSSVRRGGHTKIGFMCQASDWRSGRTTGERPSSETIAEAALTSLAKRGANRMIREIFSSASDADLIGFFCECTDPDCHKVRWLKAHVFESGCVDPNWRLLAPGHQAAVTETRERA